MKKVLAIVVALLMVMALIPVTAGAQKAETNKGRLSSTEFAPRSVATREAMRDIFNDGSLMNESFEGDSLDWWLYDADGDGYNWGWFGQEEYAYDGSNFLGSYSYNSSYGGALDTDNWAVTSDITVPATGSYKLSFYASSINASYLDSLQVLVGEEGEAYDDESIYPDAWTSVFPLTVIPNGYAQYTADLSAFNGKTIAIAFRHVAQDMLLVQLDYVQVGLEGEAVNETSVTVDPATAALTVTESVQLTATVLPENASFKDVTWTTSDPTVAVVNKNGGVLAMGVGTATITATSHNGLTATCVVTVTEGDYAYAGNLITYGVYDLDNDVEPNNWYYVDEFGLMELAAEDGANTFVKGAWNPVDQLFYAYRSNADDTMDFVSIDPANDMAVTVITAGIADNPWWMSYGFDTGVMYGGFLTFDADDNISGFNFSTIDLATGLEDEVIMDVYNQTMGGDEAMEFLPLHTTYAGGGIFIGADYSYGELIMYAANYNDQGFAAGFVSDYDLSAQVGSIATYMQDIYYNPMDGMLYWAYVSGSCKMVVMDLATGIAVPTGATGLEGASGGIECSILDGLYTMTQTYTVTFYDNEGNILSQQEVEEGADAVAPEAPEVEGYTFVGWDADYTNVQADLDIYPIYEQNPAGLIGDVDLNGTLTMADVALLYQIVLGQADVTAEAMANADVDGNGNVAMGDVAALYQIVLGN